MQYQAPVLLADAVADAGLFFAKPCGGRGVCGKCAVKASGALSVPTPQEAHLSDGLRLLCQTTAVGDAVVTLPSEAAPDGLAAGFLERQPLRGGQTGQGLAFDIGTTTVAASVFDLASGQCLGACCEGNRQAQYGADVVTRIDFANRGGRDALQSCIKEQLRTMTSALCGGEESAFSVVTGNTAMLHFLHGLSVQRMAVMPFEPTSLFGFTENNTYYPPCVSAFVGADIVCAVLYAELCSRQNAFLVDIGTNGEMVAVRDDGVFCCSTAAGPAFEGAGIAQGMTAAAGAIDRVYIANGRLEYTVHGGGTPVGICGSGLLDAVACLLELGEIDETGRLDAPFAIGDSGVFLTPRDIREVQLAKSAIRSGIDTLLADCTQSPEVFCIAGGFGSRLDLNSAVRIGLLPKNMKSKAVILGNAALGGAQWLLTDPKKRAEATALAAKMQPVPLAGTPAFSERYIENMLFPLE